jgi:hypothetical protein
MSGLSRTPGKRVGVNSPPRVRIPLPPPQAPLRGFFLSRMGELPGTYLSEFALRPCSTRFVSALLQARCRKHDEGL